MRDAWSLWPRERIDEQWQQLDAPNVQRSPDAYGVCEIANSEKERILVAQGIVREELERILRDPEAGAHDAKFFRCHVTLTDGQAQRLLEDLLRAYEEKGWPRPFIGCFPKDRPPRSRGLESGERHEDANR